MTARVLSRPAKQHHCNPGWTLRDHEWHDSRLPVGTVIECDCGQVWVCVPAVQGFVKSGAVSANPRSWRLERRGERRKRTREEANER